MFPKRHTQPARLGLISNFCICPCALLAFPFTCNVEWKMRPCTSAAGGEDPLFRFVLGVSDFHRGT